VLSCFDAILPLGVQLLAMRSYTPVGSMLSENASLTHIDPFISPWHAHDSQLRHFPSTYICVGGLDPLLDESVDFDARLARLGVDTSLQVHRCLPHAFLPMADGIPDATDATDRTSEFIGSVMDRPGFKGMRDYEHGARDSEGL